MVVVLTDGREVVIRPIRGSDREPLQRGLQKLQPRSRLFRFHRDRTHFTPEELDYLVACDGQDRIAYVARGFDESGDETDEVGVVRAYRSQEDPERAEIAVVVVDDWQRVGVGRKLLETLAQHCFDQAIVAWTAHVLGENDVAIRLLESFGEVRSRRWEAGVQELVIDLTKR